MSIETDLLNAKCEQEWEKLVKRILKKKGIATKRDKDFFESGFYKGAYSGLNVMNELKELKSKWK